MASNFITKSTFLTILYVIVMKPQILVAQQQQVPCLYFFGDSQFDNGNNNDLVTRAKANYPPYGIDSADGPTGRFSNGKNVPDFLTKFLGFTSSIPPFASARGSRIPQQQGVNYASGAAGIRDESGRQLGDRFSLNRQLLNHQTAIARLAILQGKSPAAVRSDLNRCLYVVNIGSNDYINNYLMPPPLYITSLIYTPEQYADVLIQQYSRQLTKLYELGARKIAVFGLGLLGCIPAELGRYPTNGSPCVDFINNYVQLFNIRLASLIGNLNRDLPGAKYTYIDIMSIAGGDPAMIGITVVNAPCCPVSSDGQCAPNQVPCSNRNQYVFFDKFHPTELINLVTALGAYNSTDASPVNIQSLALQ